MKQLHFPERMANIPAELKALPQWCCAGEDKRPLNPRTLTYASTTNPSDWGTFEEAVEAASKHNLHVGFVFTANDPYTCADLDDPTTIKVRGEEIPNPNEAEVERLKALHAHISAGFDSYSEVSTRGRGEHIVIEGKLPANVQRDKVELYSVNHFVIMTGNVLNNSPIRNYQTQLSNMASQMVSTDAVAELEESDPTESDEVILKRARNARNAQKFNSLWSGCTDGFPSQSEADMALFEMLCFYSQSNEQCRRLFRMSTLGQRDKATKNNVYLDRTLAKVRGRQQAETLPLVDMSGLLEKCILPPMPDTGHAKADTTPAADCDPPVFPFPVHALPPSMRDFALECSRVTKVAVSLPAACCLAVASAAIASRLKVRSIHGKLTSANLMVLAAAESGTGKGEVYRACIAPFEDCQEAMIKLWRDNVLPTAQAEVRLLEKEIKRLEGKPTGDPAMRDQIKRELADAMAKLAVAQAQLRQPVFRASDFTTQELIRILCRMDGQMFCTSPDAKNFVDMVLGRYNEGGTDEEVYLKGFSLEPVDRHRVSDGSQEIRAACIVGLWLTQPDKLLRLLTERALSEGGLLPRLLMLEVNCPPWRASLDENGISTLTRDAYHSTITSLFHTFRNQSEPRVIDSDEDARVALIEYHNAIADRREGELRDVTSFAARWGEYAWRLALVCHAYRLGADAGNFPLTLEDAKSGIALADWFANQQLEVLHAGRIKGLNELYAKVMRLFTASKTEINARDLYRHSVTPRGRREAAEALLGEMESAGLLIHEDRASARKNHTERVYRRVSK